MPTTPSDFQTLHAQNNRDITALLARCTTRSNLQNLSALATQLEIQAELAAIQNFLTDSDKTYVRKQQQQRYGIVAANKKNAWLKQGGKNALLKMRDDLQSMQHRAERLISKMPSNALLKTCLSAMQKELQEVNEILFNWHCHFFFADLVKQEQLRRITQTYRHFSASNKKTWVQADKQIALNLMAELQVIRNLMEKSPKNKVLRKQYQQMKQAIKALTSIIAEGNTTFLYDDDGIFVRLLDIDSSDFNPDLPMDRPLSPARKFTQVFAHPYTASRVTQSNAGMNIQFQRLSLRLGDEEQASHYYFNRILSSTIPAGVENTPKQFLQTIPDLHQGLRHYLFLIPFTGDNVAHLQKTSVLAITKLIDYSIYDESEPVYSWMPQVAVSSAYIIKKISATEVLLMRKGANPFELSISIKPIDAETSRQLDKFERWSDAEKNRYFLENIHVTLKTGQLEMDLTHWPVRCFYQPPSCTVLTGIDYKEKTLHFWHGYADYVFTKAAQLLAQSKLVDQSQSIGNFLLDENDLRACLIQLETHYLSCGDTLKQAQKKIKKLGKKWFTLFAQNPQVQTKLAEHIVQAQQPMKQMTEENNLVAGPLTQYLDYFDELDVETQHEQQEERIAKLKICLSYFVLLPETTQYRVMKALSQLDTATRTPLVIEALQNPTVKFPGTDLPKPVARRSFKRWVISFFRPDSIYTASQVVEFIRMLPTDSPEEQAVVLRAIRKNHQTLCNDPNSIIDLFVYAQCTEANLPQLQGVQQLETLFPLLRRSEIKNRLAYHKIKVLSVTSPAELTAACDALYNEGSNHTLEFFCTLLSSEGQVRRLLTIGLPEAIIKICVEHLFNNPRIIELFIRYATPGQIVAMQGSVNRMPHFSQKFTDVLEQYQRQAGTHADDGGLVSVADHPITRVFAPAQQTPVAAAAATTRSINPHVVNLGLDDTMPSQQTLTNV